MPYKITVTVKHPKGTFDYAFPMYGDDKDVLRMEAKKHASKECHVLPHSIKVKKIEAI